MGECHCCSRKGELNFNEIEEEQIEKIDNRINKKGTIQNNNYYTNINLNYVSSQEKNNISDLLQNNYNISYSNNNINNNFDFSSSFYFKNKESLKILMLNEINNSRKNPLSVIPKIEKYYQFIDKSNKNEYYIKVEEKKKLDFIKEEIYSFNVKII